MPPRGSSDADIENKWLKKVIKVFELMKLTDANKVDGWFDGIHSRHGVRLTWYLSESYRKGKQDAFFKLFQGSLSIREYIDKFEDLYCFVSVILSSEEAKCDRFRQGNNFRELVEATLKYEQKMSKKHMRGSQGFRERLAKRGSSSFQSKTEYSGSGRVSFVNTEQKFDKGSFECRSSGHFKKDCPLLIARDSGSQQGSVAPQNLKYGMTPLQGVPTAQVGSSASKASGATSSSQSRLIIQPGRPCTQARVFAMT
ncbi:hypothetical protein MANES_15G176252v8 [Manihot esculenta]|uniref:Uncharacterized protein n=1 Tax=Manihot esculenta TaxID=3983 RepID=A0ACB7GCJ5_MANES|nr:hypothetical protein MANES_15G176252v8 [Manihot esculenta]